MKSKNWHQLEMMCLFGFCCFLSCKTRKDILSPDLALPANYRNNVSSLSEKDSVLANIPLKQFFKNEEVKALIGDALARNYDLQIAIKNLESANLTLQQSKLGNLPVLDVQASGNSSRPSDNSLNGLSLSQQLKTSHIEDYSLVASLSWEADIWGKIKSRKAVALADFLSTEEARKAVQTSVVSSVAKSYYALLLYDDQLNIARRNFKLADSSVTIIKLQYQAGLVTSLAIQQAEAQKYMAATLIPQFEREIVIQENALSILTGKFPQDFKRSTRLSDIPVSENLNSGLPIALLDHRPDVRQASMLVSKANANVSLNRANMYPSFTITAQSGLDAIKASNWFMIPASLFGSVTGSIIQPVFQQKKLRKLYDISEVERERSVLLFKNSVLNAVGEVSDALIKRNKLGEQQIVEAGRVAILRTAITNSQYLFKNGMATYLEVITAETNALQSELSLSTIRNEQLNADVDLFRAVGGGYK